MELKVVKHDKQFNDIIMLGDIHGEFNIIKGQINHYKITDSVFIQVGDFGLGFKPKEEKHLLNRLNYKLKETNNYLFAIRGNHDDPKEFKNEWRFSNIFLVDDWTILELNDKRILCIGGAISIDREGRKFEQLGTNENFWFEDEVLQWDDDISIFDKLGKIDVMVTHTSPEYFEPMFFSQIVYDFACYDDLLLEDLRKERRLMTYLFDCIKDKCPDLKKYFYGHFHNSYRGKYNRVKWHCLSINEFKSL